MGGLDTIKNDMHGFNFIGEYDNIATTVFFPNNIPF